MVVKSFFVKKHTCGSIFQVRCLGLLLPSSPLYLPAENTGILLLVSQSVTNLFVFSKVWQISLYRFWFRMFPPSKIPGTCGGVPPRKNSEQFDMNFTTSVVVGTMDRRRRAVMGRKHQVFRDVIIKHCVSSGQKKNKKNHQTF